LFDNCAILAELRYMSDKSIDTRPDKKAGRLVVDALLLDGVDTKTIQEQTGVSRSTIQRRKALAKSNPKQIVKAEVETVQKRLKTVLLEKAMSIFDSVDDDLIAESKLKDRVTAGAIIYDKFRLASGASTSNISHCHTINQVIKSLDD